METKNYEKRQTEKARWRAQFFFSSFIGLILHLLFICLTRYNSGRNCLNQPTSRKLIIKNKQFVLKAPQNKTFGEMQERE